MKPTYLIALFFALPFIMKLATIVVDFIVDTGLEYYEKFIEKNT